MRGVFGGFRNRIWHCHSCHFHTHLLNFPEHGGVNYPCCCPTNQPGCSLISVPFTQLVSIICAHQQGAKIFFPPKFDTSTLRTPRVEFIHSHHVVVLKLCFSETFASLCIICQIKPAELRIRGWKVVYYRADYVNMTVNSAYIRSRLKFHFSLF